MVAPGLNGPLALLVSALVAAGGGTGTGQPTPFGYTVRFDAIDLEGVEGTPLPLDLREEAIARLQTWSREYPAGFLGRYVREVVVLDDLRVDGVAARGHRDHHLVLIGFRSRSGHRLEKRDFDHEVFHALDGGLREVRLPPAWEAERRRAVHLRDLWDDYRITPSYRYTFSWSRAEKKVPWMAFVPLVGLIWAIPQALGGDDASDGFAYPHGRVAPREDRAAIGEALMSGDEEFLRRAAGDDELREKVAIVKAMYRAGSTGAIDDAFWNRLAEGQFEVPSLVALEAKLVEVRPEVARRRAKRDEVTAAEGGADDTGAEAPIAVSTRLRPPVVAIAETAPAPTAPTTAPARPPVVASPGVRPVAPAPETKGAPRSAAEVYQEGLAAFRSGHHEEASRRWRSMLATVDPSYATIQVAINCVLANAEENQKALEGKASFYMLKLNRTDRTCWLSLTGLYRTPADATLAIAGLPAEIREQLPRAALVRDVLRGSR
jgi:hypothetical protein